MSNKADKEKELKALKKLRKELVELGKDRGPLWKLLQDRIELLDKQLRQ